MLLEDAIIISEPSIFEKGGLTKFFEMSLELSWNVLKEFMEAKGIKELNYPREVIKKTFEKGLITDGHNWIKALESRDLTSHVYDEARAQKVVDSIKGTYFKVLHELYHKLKPLV